MNSFRSLTVAALTALIFVALSLWSLLPAPDVRESEVRKPETTQTAEAKITPSKAGSAIPPKVVSHSKPTERDSLVAFLEPSADPRDALLLLTMQGARGDNYLERLRELVDYSSDRAMVLYLIASLAMDGDDAATQTELAALKQADPDNAVVDDLLAQRDYDEGDTEAALIHLQNAGQASKNSYFQNHYLTMLGEAYFRRNGYLTVSDFVDIIGYGAAYPLPALEALTNMCRDNASDANWRQACGARGRVMFEYGENVLERVLGASLGSQYLPGDREAFESYGREAQQTLIELSTKVEALLTDSDIIIDRQTWQAYISVYRSEGEIAAMRYLLDRFS